ncbi:MAG TPA: hypothetical protein VIV11_10795 [Kofleriaceae bacterium]
MDRRAELLGYIERTNRLQRKLALVLPVLGAGAIALMVWNGTVGGFALFIVGLVALCSFWITAAHNAAHREKLEELRRVERNDGKPLTTAHRRWHSR